MFLVVDEMVNMIVAQRAYELNSKAITASDEMLPLNDYTIDRITVKMITDAVGCSRKTFYYYFTDIYVLKVKLEKLKFHIMLMLGYRHYGAILTFIHRKNFMNYVLMLELMTWG